MLLLLLTLTTVGALVAMSFFVEGGTILQKIPPCFFILVSLYCLPVGICEFLHVNTNVALPIALNVLVFAAGMFVSKKKGVVFREIAIADRVDVAVYVALAFAVGLCGYAQFGPELLPHFMSTDAIAHCRGAQNVALTGQVSGMFYAGYCEGIWMQVFLPFVSAESLYKVFDVCEIVLLWLSGLTLYSIVKKKDSKAFLTIVIAVAACAYYVIAYPWNIVVHGFSYLGTAVSLIASIVWVVERRECFFKKVIWLAFLVLALLGLFLSYFFFVPAVYLAIAVILALWMRSSGKRVLHICLIEIALFVVPFTLGMLLVGGRYVSSFDTFMMVFTANGGIYRSLFADFIIILPLALYGAIKRRRSNTFTVVLTVCMALFALALLVLGALGYASSYYFYKCHYVLWLLLFALGVHGLYELADNNKPFLLVYVCTWAIVFSGFVYKVYGQASGAIDQDNSPIFSSCFGIIEANAGFARGETIGADELELYSKYKEILGDTPDEEAGLIGRNDSYGWFSVTQDRVTSMHRYYLFTDEELEADVSSCDYLMVITTDFARQGSPTTNGTPANEVIEKYSQIGEPLYSNDAGTIIRVNQTT